jgi:ABC-type microcin C transport system permease subunit YejB
MGLFLLKRVLTLIATLIGASIVIFLVLEILPGDAAQIMMGPDASPEAVSALASKLGLDRPPMERYLDWVGGMLTGNLGNSSSYSSPVSELVLERLEREGSKAPAAGLADELPLFVASMPAAPPRESAIERKLTQVIADELSPREALALVYELKGLLGARMP